MRNFLNDIKLNNIISIFYKKKYIKKLIKN